MHETPIPGFTLHSSRENNPPPMLRVRRRSPQAEAETWETAPAPPDLEPITWNPLTGAFGKITSALAAMWDTGRAIYDGATATLTDVAATYKAAATGIPPDEPGPIFEFVTDIIASPGAAPILAPITRAVAPPRKNVAGYITTSDGRTYPVPAYEDNATKAETARSAATQQALRVPDPSAAADRAKTALETAKFRLSREQALQAIELKERADARTERLFALQLQAAELALERERNSTADRRWWAHPSTIGPDVPQGRKVTAIGLGVPGTVKTATY